jgi:ribosomal protein S18 acetylase RimI-like enzyme
VTVAVLRHQDRSTAESIVAVQRASYAVEAELIGYDQMPGLVEDAGAVADLAQTMLGAFVSDALAGVLGYQRAGGVVDVDRLAVDPRSFRRGVGRSLMADLHQREADANRFEVSTGAANEPALSLYRSLGYEVVGTEESQGVRLAHLARSRGASWRSSGTKS